MKEEIRALIEVVGAQVREFQRFLDFLTSEAQVLTSGDLGSLQRSVSLQQEFSERMNLLEQKRQAATCSLAKKLNLKSQDLKLGKISKLVEISQSTKLRELHETLLGLCLKVERARTANELLIQQSMGMIANSAGSLSPRAGSFPGPAGTPRTEAFKPEYQVAGMMN